MKSLIHNISKRIPAGLRKSALGVLFTLAALPMMAQEAQEGGGTILIGEDFLWNLRVLVVLMIVIILILSWIALVVTIKDPAKISWEGLVANFTGSDAKDPMMDHAYDGIQELDNPIPAWLAAIFYGSVGFGIVYLFVFHVFGWAPLQEEEYSKEIALAEMTYKDVELPDDAIVKMDDQASLENGKATFIANCVACHGAMGEGGIGPNLTDAYWLHGGGIKDIYRTVTNGVPEKGMISWADQLSSVQRLEVASYISTLQGTNPPNAKEQEGTLYTGEAAVEDGGDDNGAASDTTASDVSEENPGDEAVESDKTE